MASGHFTSGTVASMYAEIYWSSSAGSGGSTVNADLYLTSAYGYYFTCYDGYGITINGNSKSSSGRVWSGSGTGLFLSHSVWVGYTGSKSVTISGNINLTGIYSSSIGGNLPNFTMSSSVVLDKIGSSPTSAKITAPGNSTISETSSTITVSWNKGSSYNGSCTYRVDVSINGGAWSWVSGDLGTNTTSYSYKIPNKEQGTTYQFRIDTGNDIGWSGHSYSGLVKINQLSAPTIGTINTYNPYVTASLTVPLSGGGQTMGGNVKRRCDLYWGDTILVYSPNPTAGNTSVALTYAAANYAAKIGTKAYSSGNFRLTAWCENDNGTRSSYVTKWFSVNLNSDGKAVPSMPALPTLSGGALGYPATCFIAGVSNVTVKSGAASVQRAPSGTTISYNISCTGMGSKSGSTVTFSGLTEGYRTIEVTATDSRGLSAQQRIKFVVQSYTPPTITITSGDRDSTTNTTVKINYSMSYSPIYAYSAGTGTQGTQLNSISSQQYSINTGAYANCTNPITKTGCSTDLTYTFNVRCSDKVRTTTYSTTSKLIGTINSFMSWRKWGLGLGMVPQSGYRLEVNGKVRVHGDLDGTGNASISGNLSVSKEFHARTVRAWGYSSPNSSSDKAGWWFKVGSIILTGQYDDCDGQIDFMIMSDGEGNLGHGTMHFRVKQQAPLGQSPVVTLKIEGGGKSVSHTNFCMTRDEMSTSRTVCSIWAKLPYNYQSMPLNPKFYAGSFYMNDKMTLQSAKPSSVIYDAIYVNGFFHGVDTTAHVSAPTMYADNWFRSRGATGWYNETHNGGINMEDNVWIRIYNNKKFYVSNNTGDAIYTEGGVTANGYLSSRANGRTMQLGSTNSGWGHITTTADSFWFNKDVALAAWKSLVPEVHNQSSVGIASKGFANMFCNGNYRYNDGHIGVYSYDGTNRIARLLHYNTQKYVEFHSPTYGLKGIYYNVSDMSLKNSILPSNINALNKLNKINLYDFYWNDSGDHQDVGFLSQQLQVVDEQYVTEMKDDNDVVSLMPNTPIILPLAVKSIQELYEEVELLKEEVNRLKGE